MAYDYAAARKIAQAQIKKYGVPGELIKSGTTGGIDSHGNPKPDEPPVTIDGTITPLADYNINEIDGTLIKAGDSWVYFDTDDLPLVDMYTTVNNIPLRVVSVNTLSGANDIVIYHKLQLRK